MKSKESVTKSVKSTPWENAAKSVKRTYLVDCENVCYKHPVVCSALAQKDAKVVFFVSEHSQGLAGNEEKVRSSARATVEFVPCVSGGKNSMDFQIVAHIGVITATVPKAKISIISNDRGYEPAIHIFSAMGRNVCCIRPADVESK